MNHHLNLNYKKVIFSLLAATCSLSIVAPTYLNATTINATTNANASSIKIKDTTLTFNSASAAPKGHIGFIINATLQRDSGIPATADAIFVHGEGKVTIDGKQYTIGISGPGKFQRISDTTAQVQLSAVPTIGKQPNTQIAKNVTPELIKGKNITITMTRVTYEKQNSTLTTQFMDQFKKAANVQGVSFEQAGLGELKGHLGGVKKTLPAGGLNIPIVEGGQSVLDNIGFVDGKLQIRVKESTNHSTFFALYNAAKKYMVDNGDHVDNIYVHIYDIKDAATLAKCSIEADSSCTLATDTESKTVNCVL